MHRKRSHFEQLHINQPLSSSDSEANLQVLQHQLQRREQASSVEAGISGIVTTGADGLQHNHIERIRALLLSA